MNRTQIDAAAQRFDAGYRHFIRRTPLWKLPGAALGVDCEEVWLKLEQLQTSGSFKARGMLNRLLSHPIPASGVIVASGGNAGIATAAEISAASSTDSVVCVTTASFSTCPGCTRATSATSSTRWMP